ncbi:MAG: 16S rRNA (cytidine(1402)-2'-O)-methyltransferase [Clostridia bacterium]|nr:16S rRNA (cytidine(1402)-2'-O)-methyltransferase [Clostridia bacterium]MBO5207379.1 16S rRNA (cytidine(1402)-2'-O)-methyltransferase [Clostridia bacterium]
MTIEEKNKTEKSTLYLVATPIGNLADLSDRAKKVLSEVDFVAAEDTRNSAKLLMLLGIRKELVSYHEHNKKQSGERLVARLLAGESCALITDAGMPAISDPGEDIVRLCADAGIRVTVVPGACAAVSALSLSALSTSRFAFEGFLPAVKGERKKRLSAVSGDDRTLIFYEAPHKLRATLVDMCDAFGGERRISLCRELTKINEEIMRTTLAEASRYYEANEPRGEYVLIVEGSSGEVISDEVAALNSLSPGEHIEKYIAEGMTKMDAIKRAARDRGMTKSELYKIINS